MKQMWYYSWLLLASVISAVCAVLAINKFRHKKSYFVGSLNMAGSAESGVVGPPSLQRPPPEQRNTQSRAVVFRKVVLRCVGYPISMYVLH